jgi:hypothetical protein
MLVVLFTAYNFKFAASIYTEPRIERYFVHTSSVHTSSVHTSCVHISSVPLFVFRSVSQLDITRLYPVHVHPPLSLDHTENSPIHTFVINTVSCHSDMLYLTKDHLQQYDRYIATARPTE